MTLRLRHHHLLCLLGYVGKGYTEAFVANLDRVVDRVSAGERILLVDGPDDVCTPLLTARTGKEPHCLRESARHRDAKAAVSAAEVLGQPLPVGAVVTLDAEKTRRLRAAFAAGTARAACVGCEWYDLCSAISADGFQGTRLA